MKGIIEKEICGKVRGFHFGTYWSMLCEEQGIKIGDADSMSDAPISKFVACVHNAANAYCEVKKIEPDFTKVDVSMWIDEVGAQQFMEDVLSAVGGGEVKNAKALERQGK